MNSFGVRAKLAARVGLLFTLAALGACGGAIETSSEGSRRDPSPGETSTPPSPTPPPAKRPPAEEPPSIDLPPPPSKIADPPTKGQTPFHLVVQNRARSVIGVDFYLDGTKVVAGGFPTQSKTTFDFVLVDGTHTLDVKAIEFPSLLAADKAIVFTLKGERWGIVDLSMARCDPCAPPEIGWQLLEEP